MARYDIESFLVDLKAALVAKLNTLIANINTEKNDSITLKTIDSGAYFLQTLNQGTVTYDPFIFYGIDKINTQSVGPETSKKYTINVIVVLADEGTDVSIANRLMRYHRCLEDLFEQNYGLIGDSLKLTIESLAPIQFVYGSEDFRAIGVSIEVPIV